MVLSLSLRARHYSDAECGPEHLGQVRKFSPPVTFNSILTSVELDPEPGTGVRTSAPFMTLTWLISPTPPPPRQVLETEQMAVGGATSSRTHPPCALLVHLISHAVSLTSFINSKWTD